MPCRRKQLYQIVTNPFVTSTAASVVDHLLTGRFFHEGICQQMAVREERIAADIRKRGSHSGGIFVLCE